MRGTKMLKNKFLMLVVALAMLVAMTGVVMAGTSSTILTASIAGDWITITAPSGDTWNLNMANTDNNLKEFPINITSTNNYDLKISGTHGGYMALDTSFAPFVNPVQVLAYYTTPAYIPVTGVDQVFYSGVGGSYPVVVKLNQIMTPADLLKTGATITLTFTAGAT